MQSLYINTQFNYFIAFPYFFTILLILLNCKSNITKYTDKVMLTSQTIVNNSTGFGNKIRQSCLSGL